MQMTKSSTPLVIDCLLYCVHFIVRLTTMQKIKANIITAIQSKDIKQITSQKSEGLYRSFLLISSPV